MVTWLLNKIFISLDSSFKITLLLRGMGWENVLSLREDYYSNLVRKFYANMLHKNNENLKIVNLHSEGSRDSSNKGEDIGISWSRWTRIINFYGNHPFVIVRDNRKDLGLK